MPGERERVLIYRLGSLGDMVVALPALHLVEQAFPAAERRMLTNFPVSGKAAAAAEVLGASGLVEGYFEYPVGSRHPLLLLKLWWRLWRWRPQLVVYLAAARGLPVARRDAWFFRMCRAGRLVGFPLTADMQVHRLQARTGALEPECERLVRNLAELGKADLARRSSWDLRLTEAERSRARAALAAAEGRPLLVFSLGTKLQANDWGKENWRELMRRIGASFPTYATAFTGVAEESAASEWVAEGWRESAAGPAINLCGQLTARESAACYTLAKLFMGHDSGPMHLAASVGTRVVGVFSSRNLPRVWFPYGAGHTVLYHAVDCMGCRLQTCVAERKKCILGITVDEVFAAVVEVLEGDAAQRYRSWHFS